MNNHLDCIKSRKKEQILNRNTVSNFTVVALSTLFITMMSGELELTLKITAETIVESLLLFSARHFVFIITILSHGWNAKLL